MRKQFLISLSLWTAVSHGVIEVSMRIERRQEGIVFVLENALGFEIIKSPRDNTILLRFNDVEGEHIKGQYDISCRKDISKLSSFIVENYSKFKSNLDEHRDNIKTLIQNFIVPVMSKNTCISENYEI